MGAPRRRGRLPFPHGSLVAVAAVAGLWLACAPWLGQNGRRAPPIVGRIVGASIGLGHKLAGGLCPALGAPLGATTGPPRFPAAARTEEVGVVIVGGGIAGLTATASVASRAGSQLRGRASPQARASAGRALLLLVSAALVERLDGARGVAQARPSLRRALLMSAAQRERIALSSTQWLVTLDIGREASTWMPPRWCASGTRVFDQIVTIKRYGSIGLTNEINFRYNGRDAEDICLNFSKKVSQECF
mmetsp:Transcript_28616/g.67082  ORF Transcript_28616/g.67082 Transcript_28616/m.67082 type:complete len:247 (-) Transcript_28616:172-912(-)